MYVPVSTNQKREALLALRERARPEAARWHRQGLTAESPEQEAAQLAARAGAMPSLWALARQRWVSPQVLGCLLGVLVEARLAELLEGRSPRGRRSLWSVDPAEVERVAATLARLADAPGTEAVRAELRVDATRYESLARSMRARDGVPHGPGRRLDAAAVIEREAALLLELHLPPAEVRAWLARLVAEWTGVAVSARRVGARQRARTARRRAPGAVRNK